MIISGICHDVGRVEIYRKIYLVNIYLGVFHQSMWTLYLSVFEPIRTLNIYIKLKFIYPQDRCKSNYGPYVIDIIQALSKHKKYVVKSKYLHTHCILSNTTILYIQMKVIHQLSEHSKVTCFFTLGADVTVQPV